MPRCKSSGYCANAKSSLLLGVRLSMTCSRISFGRLYRDIRLDVVLTELIQCELCRAWLSHSAMRKRSRRDTSSVPQG